MFIAKQFILIVRGATKSLTRSLLENHRVFSEILKISVVNAFHIIAFHVGPTKGLGKNVGHLQLVLRLLFLILIITYRYETGQGKHVR